MLRGAHYALVWEWFLRIRPELEVDRVEEARRAFAVEYIHSILFFPGLTWDKLTRHVSEPRPGASALPH